MRSALSGAAFSGTAVDDMNYSGKIVDTYVGVAALTVLRTITLPLAPSYLQGQPLYIADEPGTCSIDPSIIVEAADPDSIPWQTNIVMASSYKQPAFHSNGTNRWTL